MGHLDHAGLGWLTHAPACAMACTGAALGLRCTVRAPGTTGRARRNWLVTAASTFVALSPAAGERDASAQRPTANATR